MTAQPSCRYRLSPSLCGRGSGGGVDHAPAWGIEPLSPTLVPFAAQALEGRGSLMFPAMTMKHGP
jgi:hypothetical protein